MHNKIVYTKAITTASKVTTNWFQEPWGLRNLRLSPYSLNFMLKKDSL